MNPRLKLMTAPIPITAGTATISTGKVNTGPHIHPNGKRRVHANTKPAKQLVHNCDP